MVPLPDALKTQTIAAAATIEAQAGTTATATTTALEVTPVSPVPVGTTETLTAMVTPTPTGQPAVGSVQFQDATVSIGSPVAVSGATATITTTLSSGTHSLTAVFTPTDPRSFSRSVSSPVSYVVNAATGAVATTTTLTGSPNPAVPIILRATVVPASAVGTVEITDGTSPRSSLR
jgi:Bacterial Ig-like domain (group 3)